MFEAIVGLVGGRTVIVSGKTIEEVSEKLDGIKRFRNYLLRYIPLPEQEERVKWTVMGCQWF